jgi:DNA polymerase III subunit delta'
VTLSSLRGQPGARKTLERALGEGRVHHAYRFEGPPGVGKRLAADLLAQALLCEIGQGCGECSACRRAVTVAAEAPHVPLHPDHIVVQRGLYPPALLGASEATGISVEQVRKIVLPRMGFPPHEGKALVVTILDAHELTLSAANALLKTLEEPPPNTYFILLTSRPQKLPDTIRSRTLKVRFSPLPKDTLQELAGGLKLDDELLNLAQGSLERARELCDENKRQSRAQFWESAREAVAAKHPSQALTFAEQRPESRDDVLELLRYMSSRIAHETRKQFGDGSSPQTGQAGRAPSARYFEVERAAREIEQNASPALALESLILRLRQIPGLRF